jgi:hypothetical protein
VATPQEIGSQLWAGETPDSNPGLQDNSLANMLLNKLNGHAVNGQLIFFSDEKNFSKDQKTNRKNKQWCSDISEVPIVMATKFLATVMVLGFVSNGLWCPLISFPRG